MCRHALSTSTVIPPLEIMKKTFFILITGLMCLTTLTSCDEDQRISMRINGEWYGNFGMYYNYEGYDPYGRYVRRSFDSYETDIRFVQSGFSDHGEGFQVDHYREGPYEFLSYRFHWEVRNGVLYLTYPPRYSDYNTEIYDYTLSYNYFKGYFSNATQPFSLRNLSNYDWDYYGYGREYWWYERPNWSFYPYYSPAKDNKDGQVPVAEKAEQSGQEEGLPKGVVSIGNHHTDALRLQNMPVKIEIDEKK